MSVNRFYSSTAVVTAIVGNINNTTPTINVVSVAGYPTSFPYTGIIDRGTTSEEIVTVTGASGTTLTCTRGVDGSSAVSHTSGATFEHGISARDFAEPQAHIAASSNVHGITGQVVGDSDAQTLLNKTLEQPTLDQPVVNQPVMSDYTNATHDHSTAFHGGLIPAASVTLAGANYNPTLGSSGVAPAVGNGAIHGYYMKIGKLVFYWWRLNVGSTTTFGTGSLNVSLPVPATSPGIGPNAQLNIAGTVRITRASGSPNVSIGQCSQSSGTTLGATFESSTTIGDMNTWGSGSYPVNVSNTGDIYDGFLVYEAA